MAVTLVADSGEVENPLLSSSPLFHFPDRDLFLVFQTEIFNKMFYQFLEAFSSSWRREKNDERGSEFSFWY